MMNAEVQEAVYIIKAYYKTCSREQICVAVSWNYNGGVTYPVALAALALEGVSWEDYINSQDYDPKVVNYIDELIHKWFPHHHPVYNPIVIA